MLLIENAFKAWRADIAESVPALRGITFLSPLDVTKLPANTPTSVMTVKLGKSSLTVRVPFVMTELVTLPVANDNADRGDVDRLVNTILSAHDGRRCWMTDDVRIHWIDQDSQSDSISRGGLRQAVIAWTGFVSWRPENA